MPLRLSAEGARKFDEWRTQYCKSPEDEKLVAEVLRSVANYAWQGRWDAYKNETEPDITVIQPREGLFVQIRLWTDHEDEFTLITISDIDQPTAD